MRKFLIVLAFAGVSMGSMAQDTTPTEKYSVATNSFWSNWFLQVGVDWNAFYGNQEYQGNMNLPQGVFKGFRTSPGLAIGVGKWFTPGIGGRFKLQGFWGKTVQSDNSTINKNRYWTAQGQVLFNLSNMICGYNPTRVWNFIPFIGAGMTRSMKYDAYGMTESVGILNEFRVSKRLAVNLEIGWNYEEMNSDGLGNGYSAWTGKKFWDSHDQNLYAELGLTYNIGKTGWSKTPDVNAIKALSQAQIDALNSQLNDANAENARLKQALDDCSKKAPETPEVKKVIAAPIAVSVFFNINKTDIYNPKDMVNIEALAKYAVANNSNVLVMGYADAATRTPAINQVLSVKRAGTLADELVKLGVNRGNIKTVANGGSRELSPISFNRRATAKVVE